MAQISLEASVVKGKDVIIFKIDNLQYILTPPELTEIGFSKYIKNLEMDDKELTFDHYRLLRRLYNQMERSVRKTGTLIHLSKVSDKAWKEMNKEFFEKHGYYPEQKGKTYVKEDENA